MSVIISKRYYDNYLIWICLFEFFVFLIFLPQHKSFHTLSLNIKLNTSVKPCLKTSVNVANVGLLIITFR